MRKSLGLALVLSLLIFMMLNFLTLIISASMDDNLQWWLDRFEDAPGIAVGRLFFPMVNFPWELAERAGLEYATEGQEFYNIMCIINLVIAAFVAGIAAGDVQNAIIAWVMVGVISLIAVGTVVSDELVRWNLYGTGGDVTADMIVPGVINIMLFGLITIITALIAGNTRTYNK